MLDALVQRSEWQFCHFAQNTLVILIIEPCCVCLSVALPIEMCNWMSCLFAIIMCFVYSAFMCPKNVCLRKCVSWFFYLCLFSGCMFCILSLPPPPSVCSECVCARQTCPCPGAKDHDATVFKLEYSLPPDVSDGYFGTKMWQMKRRRKNKYESVHLCSIRSPSCHSRIRIQTECTLGFVVQTSFPHNPEFRSLGWFTN